MSKKKSKKKKKIQPVNQDQNLHDTDIGYRKTKIKTNIGFIFFSVIFTACLFLPYFSPASIGPEGIIYRPELVKVIDIFLVPLLYQGAMALICVMSILSIILKKSYSPIVYSCIIVCFLEFFYHISLGTNIILAKDLSFGAGYWILLIAYTGFFILVLIDFCNEHFSRE